jgi:lysophospholipase L1-like esterase
MASATTPPNSMTALGDSITQAATTCDAEWSCPENSWVSGTNSSVNSHYQRILKHNPKIRGNNYNDSVSGSVASDMPGQASRAVSRGVDYVTLEIGGNDACTSSPDTMTSVASYRASIDTTLDRLNAGLPNANILVASIPNVYRLWQVGHSYPLSVWYWDTAGICQSMMANATSTSATDEARRQTVLQRVKDYNTQLAQSCAAHTNCRFDSNAVFNWQFAYSDLSWDTFHPSIAGQGKLAAATYSVYGW